MLSLLKSTPLRIVIIVFISPGTSVAKEPHKTASPSAGRPKTER